MGAGVAAACGSLPGALGDVKTGAIAIASENLLLLSSARRPSPPLLAARTPHLILVRGPACRPSSARSPVLKPVGLLILAGPDPPASTAVPPLGRPPAGLSAGRLCDPGGEGRRRPGRADRGRDGRRPQRRDRGRRAGRQGRRSLRRRGDRRQGADRLSRLHRPLHDPRPAGGVVRSLDRRRAGRSTTPTSPWPRTPPDNRQRDHPRIRGGHASSTCPTPRPTSAGGSASPTSSPPPAARSRPARASWSAPSGLPRREAIVRSPGRPPHQPRGRRASRRPAHARPERADPGRRHAAESGPTGGDRATRRALMGVVAHLRQAMLDAENHHERLGLLRARRAARGPPFDPALDGPPRRQDQGPPGLVGGEHPRRDPPGARPGRGVRHRPP